MKKLIYKPPFILILLGIFAIVITEDVFTGWEKFGSFVLILFAWWFLNVKELISE